MRIVSALLGAAALIALSGAALADHHMAKAIKVGKTAAGEVLTNAKGMTLYIFDKDKPGVSNCKGECARKWPPMPATASSKSEGDFSVIKRADGSYQWAYKGKPLYTWFKDKKPGDTTGDGVKGVWHLARP
ncbi:MAG: hypothetical protein Kow0032_23750 [Methyloligellaceae bacterium]